jgi:hypothetical protein
MEITEDKKEIIFIIVMLHNIDLSNDTIKIVILRFHLIIIE